jgi:integrase/recombinase XerD
VNLKTKDIDLLALNIKVVGKGQKYREIPLKPEAAGAIKEYLGGERKDSRFGQSELEKQITPHTFRHGFASHLVKNNANIVSISKLMGHSDIKVTSVYTHAGLEMLEDAVALM